MSLDPVGQWLSHGRSRSGKDWWLSPGSAGQLAGCQAPVPGATAGGQGGSCAHCCRWFSNLPCSCPVWSDPFCLLSVPVPCQPGFTRGQVRGWCFVVKEPTDSLGRQAWLGGSQRRVSSPVSQTTCGFALEPVRAGPDLCAGFWGHLKAAGAGDAYPPPIHLSFLIASSSSQLRPPWGLVQPRVTRRQGPGPSASPCLLFQSERRADTSPCFLEG